MLSSPSRFPCEFSAQIALDGLREGRIKAEEKKIVGSELLVN
jgi:hypothetical protein